MVRLFANAVALALDEASRPPAVKLLYGPHLA
jgi:hypothetical protein